MSTPDDIEWPSIERVAMYLADLEDEPFDEISQGKYTANATALLAWLQSELIYRQ